MDGTLLLSPWAIGRMLYCCCYFFFSLFSPPYNTYDMYLEAIDWRLFSVSPSCAQCFLRLFANMCCCSVASPARLYLFVCICLFSWRCWHKRFTADRSIAISNPVCQIYISFLVIWNLKNKKYWIKSWRSFNKGGKKQDNQGRNIKSSSIKACIFGTSPHTQTDSQWTFASFDMSCNCYRPFYICDVLVLTG